MSRPDTGLATPLALAVALALALALTPAFPLSPTPGGGAALAATMPLPPGTPGRAANAAPTVASHDLHHDLHIAYADMAIEGCVIAGRIRIFKHDLERALSPLVGADAVSLRPGSEADALVMRYLREHLVIEAVGGAAAAGRAGGEAGTGVRGPSLEPTLLQSGQDELDREPVWWVIVQYEAMTPIDTLRVRNTILFEVFDDQRNIMKFVRFPGESQKTFYFDKDESEHVVTH